MEGTERKEQIRSYLLLELGPEDMDRFEEEYFDDAELLGEILEAEADMIDDYVLSRMTPDMKSRFEKMLAQVPVRRERVETARAFFQIRTEAGEAEASPEPTPSIFERLGHAVRITLSHPAPYLGIALIVAAVIAFTILNSGDLEVAEKMVPQPSGDNTAASVEPVPDPAAGIQQTSESGDQKPAATVATFFLSPGGFRGGDGSATRILPAKGSDEVRLGLRIDSGFESSSYSIRLDGKTLRSAETPSKQKDGTTTLFVTLKAGAGSPSRHVLTLVAPDGTEENYIFLADLQD